MTRIQYQDMDDEALIAHARELTLTLYPSVENLIAELADRLEYQLQTGDFDQ